MSKNTELEQLTNEIAVLPQVLLAAHESDDSQAVILARFIKGISNEKWKIASNEYLLDHWHVYPVAEGEDELVSEGDDTIAVSPFRDVKTALSKGMFTRQLQRELIRLNRNGGSLSLISASLAKRDSLATALGEGTVKRLETLLGVILMDHLEDCDTMGILRRRQYICSLPGLGQLATRNFAEKVQRKFEDEARPYFPTGGINAGKTISCAIGIITIPQGEGGTAKDLIKRAKSALELAFNKSGKMIYQQTSSLPLENPTLVQSSEKRFLFFGGDNK